jgi:type II secretory pathway pseudopilin PulG
MEAITAFLSKKHFAWRQSRAGFTLLELLLYSAIVGIISVGLVSITSSIYNYYLNVQVKTNLSQSLRFVAQSIQQAITGAVSMATSSGGSTLVLSMNTHGQNPTKFGLLNGRIYKKEANGAPAFISPQNLEVTQLDFSLLSIVLAEALPPNEWAWSGGGSSNPVNEGIGWVDFYPPIGDLKIPIGAGDFYGMAYLPAPDAYISFNCLSTDSCASIDYKVSSDIDGNVYGWAWSDLFGWISFSDVDASSTIPYQVTISSSTGIFSGWAWGENLGWISFNCSNSEVNSCAAVNYKVQANRKQGTPSNTIFVNMTMRNRSTVQRFQLTDTYQFAVPFSQISNITIYLIAPTGATSTVIFTVTGDNFVSGAKTKLTRAGFSDIMPSTECIWFDSTILQSCQYDVTGQQPGLWNLEVLNPDGQKGILPGGFTISSP